jgi:tRNA 5-methylaminomethyl-2-thiouridine biosynthesis bifunctional protein
VHPPSLCAALLRGESRVDLRLACAVLALAHTDGGWAVEIHDRTRGRQVLRADAVVLATALDTRALIPALPLRAIAGQITMLAANVTSARLRTVLCGRGYVAPARQGRHTLGATHRLNEAATDLRDVDHDHNLAALRGLAPELAATLAIGDRPAGGRAGIRCTSPDTLPVVGAVDPRHLYVTTAHGSRGLVTTLLAAEVVASALAGEPPPLPRELVQRLSPLRFRRTHPEPALWHHRGNERTGERA